MTKDKKSQPKKPGKIGRFIKPRFKRKQARAATSEPIPRITNDTVSQHREEVLSGARRFIYPLKHSRHKVVLISVTILVAVIISFMTYILLSLYKFQSTSAFTYQVTKVLPLPVARVGGKFISYENYLFELRRYIHYFETQPNVDFSTPQGKSQLDFQRKKALEKVVDQAYIAKMAQQRGISVSSQEIDAQIQVLKEQSRLGNDNKLFEDVLKDYWGWSVSDFRRTITDQLLAQKLRASLSPDALTKANDALAQLKSGKDFALVAKTVSEDPGTKDNGGDYGHLISKTDRTIPPQTTEALFKLKAGEYSGIVDVGNGLVIVKNLGYEGEKAKAAIIFFKYEDLDKFVNDYKAKQKATIYLNL